jgi:hypothetical protein
VQQKHENEYLLYVINEDENNRTRLWCKIVLKISVEQTKGNERCYFYLYHFGDLI